VLFQEVDKKKTRNNVDNLLSNYHRLKRLAGRPVEQNVTATFSLQPKGSSRDNTSNVERGVIKKLDADLTLKRIETAFNCLGPDTRRRLYLKYMNRHITYDYEIYTEDNISEATYYRELQKSLIEFAECFNGGKLIVYEEEEENE